MRALSRYVTLIPALAPNPPQEAVTMAKHKNRKQSSQQNRGPASEQAAQEAKSSATEAQTPVQTQAQGSPADVARKHQRRFGHN